MSRIPNSAMPHAGTIHEIDEQQEETGRFDGAGRAFSQIAEKVRENPKTAIAAGAAVAGVMAAATIGARSYRGNSGGKGKKKKD